MKPSLATDAIKLTTSKIITMAISMVCAMLLSRFRTLEEYGTYSQILLIINLVTTIFIMGLPNSINFFLAQTNDIRERKHFLSTYYILSTILSFSTGLLLIVSMPLIVRYFNNNLIKDFLYILAIFPWAKITLSSIDNILIVYKKTNYLMMFRILNSIFLLLIILITKLFNLGFDMYMALFVGVEVVFAFSVYLLVRKIVGKIELSLNTNLIRRIMRFSIPMGLATVAGTLKKELDKLVIAGFYNTESLAIYTNAAREMPVVVIASSVTAVLLPQMVKMLKENKKVEAVSLWGDATLFSYIIISFLATGFFVYAPDVMSLLYSEKYISGSAVFRVYAIVLLFRSTYFGMVLNSIGKTKVIFYSAILSLILNLVLNFLFYHIFGFIGPAIATLFATSVSAVYQLMVTAKEVEIPFSHVFPWKEIGYITIINICLGGLFAMIKSVLPCELLLGEVVESIFLGVIWGTIYFFINYKLLKIKWKTLSSN